MNADLHVLGRRIGWERGVPGVELYMDQIVLTAGATERRRKAPVQSLYAELSHSNIVYHSSDEVMTASKARVHRTV